MAPAEDGAHSRGYAVPANAYSTMGTRRGETAPRRLGGARRLLADRTTAPSDEERRTWRDIPSERRYLSRRDLRRFWSAKDKALAADQHNVSQFLGGDGFSFSMAPNHHSLHLVEADTIHRPVTAITYEVCCSHRHLSQNHNSTDRDHEGRGNAYDAASQNHHGGELIVLSPKVHVAPALLKNSPIQSAALSLPQSKNHANSPPRE